MSHYLLAIDQGTTSSRAIIFDAEGGVRASAQQEFPQHYPGRWLGRARSRGALGEHPGGVSPGVGGQRPAGGGHRSAIGIANQRETTLVWDAASGAAIHPAIVWQDRRTADDCAALKAAGHEEQVSARTGLLLDPYFSASKLRWILDHVPGARARGRARRAALRHRGQLPALAPDRRAGAPHRRQQRRAHPAVQHPHPAMGCRPAGAVRDSRQPAARGAAIAPPSSASPSPAGSARPCRCWAWPATSRPR